MSQGSDDTRQGPRLTLGSQKASGLGNLTSANQMKDKKLFKKSLEGLVKAHTKTQKNILREALKMHDGRGAFHDLPPDGFSSQISDEKKRKALFVQQCREEMKLSI